MSQEAEPVYLLSRRKQACTRCHKKRIKCLGGVPCRNCTISSTPCTFPPPKNRRYTVNSLPTILPSTGDAPVSATSPSAAGNYRRSEKVFASARSADGDGHITHTYRATPSCTTFAENLAAYLAQRRTELSNQYEAFFDPLWGDLQDFNDPILEQGLEITISNTSQPLQRPAAAKPATIKLPPYNYSINLIQNLEAAIGFEQHYFMRRDLRTKVTQMHQNPTAAQSNDHGWLCHWLAILALGELYSCSISMTDQLPGANYYEQSVSLLQQVAETPNIQYIETLTLLALYAFSLNRPNTAYMYVGVSLRAALSLNLHRDPSDFPSGRSSLSVVELEHQKRLFWAVYYQDLLTTTTTGRPWGVLDDEITVGYASYDDLAGEALLEFSDAEEVNAHLELMRLRSQAYSSLYGYAGTAINPQSHISLFTHSFSTPLSIQLIDKIYEFYGALRAWDSELSPSVRLVHHHDGTIINLRQSTANLYLLYHQSILVLLRPALVHILSAWLIPQHDTTATSSSSMNAIFPTTTLQATEFQRVTHLLELSLHSAHQTAAIIQWLMDNHLLSMLSYFSASHALTAALTLVLTKTVCSHVPHLRHLTAGSRSAPSTLDTDLGIVRSALHMQRDAGSVCAKEFVRLLELVVNNLEALESVMEGKGLGLGDGDGEGEVREFGVGTEGVRGEIDPLFGLEST